MNMFGPSKAERDKKEAATILRQLMEGVRDGENDVVYQNVQRLAAKRDVLDEVPESLQVLGGAIDIIGRRSAKDGFDFIFLMLTRLHVAGVRELMAEKTFALFEKADRKNYPAMKAAQQTALALVSHYPPRSATEARAMKMWSESVEAVAAMKDGLSAAFYFASDSAIAGRLSTTMHRRAADLWESLMEQAKKTDPALAKREAERVLRDYRPTTVQGTDLRRRAEKALRSLP